MNKFNKKGFTLIEMLVVIAIIAVLVSIVIPTVSSSTVKAKAATDAANLRSAKAAITIGVLDGTITTEAQAATVATTNNGVPANSKMDGGAFRVELGTAATNTSGITVKVYYGSHDIAYYAEAAGGSSTDATPST